MTECKGIFGKWFGHKFKQFLISQRPSAAESNSEGVLEMQIRELLKTWNKEEILEVLDEES